MKMSLTKSRLIVGAMQRTPEWLSTRTADYLRKMVSFQLSAIGQRGHDAIRQMEVDGLAARVPVRDEAAVEAMQVALTEKVSRALSALHDGEWRTALSLLRDADNLRVAKVETVYALTPAGREAGRALIAQKTVK
jgi:hypothetical protein